MSADGIAGIGAAAVSTVGTLAVTGMAVKAIGKTTQNLNHSGRSSGDKRTGNKSHYNVFKGTKHSGKKHKSMLGF